MAINSYPAVHSDRHRTEFYAIDTFDREGPIESQVADWARKLALMFHVAAERCDELLDADRNDTDSPESDERQVAANESNGDANVRHAANAEAVSE